MNEKTIKELENKLEKATNDIIKAAKLYDQFWKDLNEIPDRIFDDDENACETGNKRIIDLLKKVNYVRNSPIESLI